MQFKEYLLNVPTFRAPRPAEARRSTACRGLTRTRTRWVHRRKRSRRCARYCRNVNRYSDPGSWPLRRTLGAHFDIAPEQILCTNGSDEMIYMLCLAFLREGDEAVMADGSFVSYGMRTMAMGGQPLRVPLRDYVHDLDAMADAITERTRLIFLCNPNNPTGTTVDAETVARFISPRAGGCVDRRGRSVYRVHRGRGHARPARRGPRRAAEPDRPPHLRQDLRPRRDCGSATPSARPR